MHRFLRYEYHPGGRGEDGRADCWGLVRIVRTERYGLPELPEFAQAVPGDSSSIHAAYLEQERKMRQVPPRPGAIAAVLRRGACLHVAILVEGGMVLDIRRKGVRARLMRHSDWLRDYPEPLWEVRYYCDQDYPPQAIE